MAKSTHVLKYQKAGEEPVSIALYDSKDDLIIDPGDGWSYPQAVAFPVEVDGEHCMHRA